MAIRDGDFQAQPFDPAEVHARMTAGKDKVIMEGLRVVAVFEAAKGALVLLVGLGLLSLIHRDIEAVAEHIVRLGHLNPASHYPRVFIEAASHVTDGRLWAMAGAAAVYAIVRFVEAYGLWHERRWAEWFALFAGGLYLPVEVFELVHHPSWTKVAILGTNIAIVVYMVFALLLSRTEAGSSDTEVERSGEGI